MPTIHREGPYRFYFFSHEPNEPAHIHVDRDEYSAKFWLDPVGLVRNYGFSSRELNRIHQMVVIHRNIFRQKWDGYFSIGGR